MSMTATNTASGSIHSDFGMQGRQWERFAISRVGRIISVGANLSGLSYRTCELIDISRGGAAMKLDNTIGMPDHYYLMLLGTDLRIGCAEVYRQECRVGVRFIKTLDQEFLSMIVRGDFFTK